MGQGSDFFQGFQSKSILHEVLLVIFSFALAPEGQTLFLPDHCLARQIESADLQRQQASASMTIVADQLVYRL